MGRLLIYAGVVLIVIGLIVSFVPVRFGRLPGDIVARGRNTTFYFPIVTCLILSVILTLISWLFSRR